MSGVPVGIEESGREPVSGKQGQGTATEPFDQGNDQKDGKAGATAEGLTSSATETAKSAADAAKNVVGSTKAAGSAGNAAKSSKISKLFGKKGKAPVEQPETLAGADLSDRPPNHLGEDVPPGVEAPLEKRQAGKAAVASGSKPEGGGKRRSGFFGLFGGPSASQDYVTTQGGKKVKAGGKPVGQAAMKDRKNSKS